MNKPFTDQLYRLLDLDWVQISVQFGDDFAYALLNHIYDKLYDQLGDQLQNQIIDHIDRKIDQ
jgi:hypothetical protein